MLGLLKKKPPQKDCIACKEMLKIQLGIQNNLANELSKAGLELLKSAYENKLESLRMFHDLEVSSLRRELACLQRILHRKEGD